MEPGNRRPAPGAGSAPLPANSSVTGEQAAVGSRQPGPSGAGATDAAVLAGPVPPSHPSGPLKSTAMDSDPFESGVSSETTNRRMSSDKSGPLSGMPDAPLQTLKWPTPAYQQGSVLTRRPSLFQVLVTPVPS